MPLKLTYILLFSLISCKVFAQSFEMNEPCLDAYKSFMSMKIEQGKSILVQELKRNPKNLLPHILANYEDFISLVFNENPVVYSQRKKFKDKRLSILENADKNSPYYLFSKALLYFQWSMIEIKYTDYLEAALDFRKSYLLFNENARKFPSFAYNSIFIGSEEAVISTIPKGYQWISKLMGMRGNLIHGMATLKSSISLKEQPFKEEAFLFYIYLKNYIENDIEGANAIITNYHLDIKNNQLYCFMAANLALNNKKAEKAENILNARSKGPEYIPFPMLDYELGDAKLRRLDYTAIQQFQQFLSTSKSNFYLKDACLNIAYCYYLMGDTNLANQYKDKIKTIGKTESDADQQAQKFALNGSFPDKQLLKARLLNDGGYNERALKLLQSKDIKSFEKEGERLEYIYRFGRVYDDLKQDDKALEYYIKTIELGRNSEEYFAARAALQAGYLYELKGQKKEALRYYNMILDMGNHAYKNSLDQRAKSGINRLQGS